MVRSRSLHVRDFVTCLPTRVDLIGLRAPRVAPGNDSDGFFFRWSFGAFASMRKYRWRVGSTKFSASRNLSFNKKVVLQRQTRPKQDNRRKARQHVKLLSRFNQGISSTLYYSRSPMMGSRLQAIKRQQNIEALFPEIQSS